MEQRVVTKLIVVVQVFIAEREGNTRWAPPAGPGVGPPHGRTGHVEAIWPLWSNSHLGGIGASSHPPPGHTTEFGDYGWPGGRWVGERAGASQTEKTLEGAGTRAPKGQIDTSWRLSGDKNFRIYLCTQVLNLFVLDDGAQARIAVKGWRRRGEGPGNCEILRIIARNDKEGRTQTRAGSRKRPNGVAAGGFQACGARPSGPAIEAKRRTRRT